MQIQPQNRVVVLRSGFAYDCPRQDLRTYRCRSKMIKEKWFAKLWSMPIVSHYNQISRFPSQISLLQLISSIAFYASLLWSRGKSVKQTCCADAEDFCMNVSQFRLKLLKQRPFRTMNIQIQVLHSSEFDGATWYAIRVRENHQEWLIQKRFRQFVELDSQLASTNGELSRLPLPTKLDSFQLNSWDQFCWSQIAIISGLLLSYLLFFCWCLDRWRFLYVSLVGLMINPVCCFFLK